MIVGVTLVIAAMVNQLLMATRAPENTSAIERLRRPEVEPIFAIGHNELGCLHESEAFVLHDVKPVHHFSARRGGERSSVTPVPREVEALHQSQKVHRYCHGLTAKHGQIVLQYLKNII